MSVHEPRPTPFGIAFVRRCAACDGLWPCRDELLARNQGAQALLASAMKYERNMGDYLTLTQISEMLRGGG